MSSSHLLVAALTLWKETSSSSYLGRPDGVCVLLSRQEHLSCYIFSPYHHGSLGHGHDTYVFGGYIRGPHRVRVSTFIPYQSPLSSCVALAYFSDWLKGGYFLV